MQDFFRGWKRKTGCVTLLLACVFAAGWVRSRETLDTFGARYGDSPHLWLESENQALRVCLNYDLHVGTQCITGWRSQPVNKKLGQLQNNTADHTASTWNYKKFKVEWQEMGETIKFKSIACRAPYWAIVLPLTLLSAYLLFSRPRTANVDKRRESLRAQEQLDTTATRTTERESDA